MEEVAPKLKQQLSDIENEPADIKNKGKSNTEEDRGTMVVGGFGTDGDEDEAMDWINR